MKELVESCDADSDEDLERLTQRLAQLETKMGNQQLMDAVTTAKALAHPWRLKLLAIISDREVCVCKLVKLIDLSQPAISHHLNILARAGLLHRRRQGRYNHYQVDPERVSQLAATLQDLLNE